MLICPHCRQAVAENPALDGHTLICPCCGGQFFQAPITGTAPAPLLPLVSGSASGIHLRGGPKSFKRKLAINPVAAGMLSLLLPGLGQFVQGRSLEGTLFLIAAVVACLTGCVAGPAGFLFGAVVLVWSIVDAATH